MDKKKKREINNNNRRGGRGVSGATINKRSGSGTIVGTARDVQPSGLPHKLFA